MIGSGEAQCEMQSLTPTDQQMLTDIQSVYENMQINLTLCEVTIKSLLFVLHKPALSAISKC